MAQQIQDNDEVYTFRKWNPDKTMVPYGQSTDADADGSCGPNFLCYACMCVNVFLAYAFEEVVDMATDGLMSPEFYFKQ